MTLVDGGESNHWPEWPVVRSDELDDPDARSFSVGDDDWPFEGFVVRRHGEIFAYANICPHRLHPLDPAPHAFLVDNGNLIRCASHGALFCPETGVCLIGPCVGRSLIALQCSLDSGGMIKVRAPATRRDHRLPDWCGKFE